MRVDGLAAVTDDPSYHALVMQVNIDEDRRRSA